MTQTMKIELLNGQYDLVINNKERILEMLKQLSPDHASEDIPADTIEHMLM